MTPTASTTLRGDLNQVVEEAAAMDRFFIGHLVLPALRVDTVSGQYPKLTLTESELLKAGATKRESGASYGRVKQRYTSDTYTCLDRGLEVPVDDNDKAAVARYFDAEAAAAKHAMRMVRLDHEIRVAAAIMNATTFGAGTNSVVAYTYANIATIDFSYDVREAVRRVKAKGVIPNTVVLSDTVFNRVRESTLLKNNCGLGAGSGKASPVTAALMGTLFADDGITNVYVAKAVYDSADKGQTASVGDVWGTTYVWVGNVTGGPIQEGGAGRTLAFNSSGLESIWETMTYRDEVHKSDIVRVSQNTDEKITDSTAGTLITTQYE